MRSLQFPFTCAGSCLKNLVSRSPGYFKINKLQKHAHTKKIICQRTLCCSPRSFQSPLLLHNLLATFFSERKADCELGNPNATYTFLLKDNIDRASHLPHNILSSVPLLAGMDSSFIFTHDDRVCKNETWKFICIGMSQLGRKCVITMRPHHVTSTLTVSLFLSKRTNVIQWNMGPTIHSVHSKYHCNVFHCQTIWRVHIDRVAHFGWFRRTLKTRYSFVLF